MALTATPNWEVSATVADRDKNLRSISFNLPSALTFAAATTAAEAIITAAATLINGVIVRYGLLGGKYESTYPATLPPEGSDVERKGVFVFNTTVFGQHVKVELPSINNDYVVDGSNIIDQADADVAAFVDAMVDTGLGAGNSPVSATGADITGLFGAPKKIHRKSSKG